MNQNNFNIQINKMKDCFSDKSFSDVRVKMIWKELKDFPDAWFEKTCDYFIRNFKTAPMIGDFCEQAAIERERIRDIEKKSEKMDAVKFFNQSSIDENDTKFLIDGIIKRIKGQISDDEFESYRKMIHGISNMKVQSMREHGYTVCPRCENSGVYFKIYKDLEFVYKCSCKAGRQDPRKYYVENT